jgi:hypothetical protein
MLKAEKTHGIDAACEKSKQKSAIFHPTRKSGNHNKASPNVRSRL